MAKEHEEETILRITAHYVAEVEAGTQPHLSTYIERYPQHAGALSDFVAYYHAVEANLAQEEEAPPLDQAESQQLFKTALQRASFRAPSLTTLFPEPLSAHQLAPMLDLSEDMLLLLEARTLDEATIPRALVTRLALSVEQPVDVVQDYLRQPQKGRMRELPEHVRRVAEESSEYVLQGKIAKKSFGEALAESEATEDQKAYWLVP